MALVRFWRTKKWRARQVTDSPGQMRPEQVPAVACSPKWVLPRRWTSMERARSKTRASGVWMTVVVWREIIGLVLFEAITGGSGPKHLGPKILHPGASLRAYR